MKYLRKYLDKECTGYPAVYLNQENACGYVMSHKDFIKDGPNILVPIWAGLDVWFVHTNKDGHVVAEHLPENAEWYPPIMFDYTQTHALYPKKIADLVVARQCFTDIKTRGFNQFCMTGKNRDYKLIFKVTK